MPTMIDNIFPKWRIYVTHCYRLSNSTVEDQIKANGVFTLTDYTKGVQPLDLNHGGEQHVTVIGHDRSVVTITT